jgi:hypothetical protein
VKTRVELALALQLAASFLAGSCGQQPNSARSTPFAIIAAEFRRERIERLV